MSSKYWKVLKLLEYFVSRQSNDKQKCNINEIKSNIKNSLNGYLMFDFNVKNVTIQDKLYILV